MATANNNCADGKDNDCDSQTDTADTECDECITMPTLLRYIEQWKEANMTMLSLMQRIAQWKAGTGC